MKHHVTVWVERCCIDEANGVPEDERQWVVSETENAEHLLGSHRSYFDDYTAGIAYGKACHAHWTALGHEVELLIEGTSVNPN